MADSQVLLFKLRALPKPREASNSECKVLQWPAVEAQSSENPRHQIAKALIRKAANILGEMGAEEQRIGWMLEDCVDLIIENERQVLSRDRVMR
ncbi:MAG: hypothetical protein K1X83_10985 [Oligoflexia bacterium]|nr:hypothetical protein [Oligoflexia bacterium]